MRCVHVPLRHIEAEENEGERADVGLLERDVSQVGALHYA